MTDQSGFQVSECRFSVGKGRKFRLATAGVLLTRVGTSVTAWCGVAARRRRQADLASRTDRARLLRSWCPATPRVVGTSALIIAEVPSLRPNKVV